MLELSTGCVNSNGIRLHYYRSGGNKPVMVFAHGFTDNGLCWSRLAERLVDDFDLILYDARGHGLSDAPETGYWVTYHAADLAGLVTGLKLDKPIVIGHSMGAATAAAFAGLYPDLPGAVILEDPPPPLLKMPENLVSDPHAKRPSIDFAGKSREEIMAMGREQNPKWDESEFGPWADSKMQFNVRAANIFAEAPEIDLQKVTACITCPVLLITADIDLGSILSPEAAQAFQAAVPQTKIAHIAGAGHNIRREQFEEYVRVVKEFAKKNY